MNQEEIEKIERYIKGLADNNESAYVQSSFLNGEENSTLRLILEKDWDCFLSDTSTSEVDLYYLLDRIHHEIKKKESQKRHGPMQKFINIYSRVAAILLIPLLIATGLFYKYLGNLENKFIEQKVNTTIYAPMGSRVSFNLPDGTVGMLNSGSHLSYSLPFINYRNVKLEGEAWFEVTHDEKHPFEINAGSSTVAVLGTNLNVSAYPAENYVEVVLQHGKVEFIDDKLNEKVAMLPSERLVFQNGNINKSVIEPSKYNAWTQGKLVFRGDPMAEVGRRLEQWYNVKVVLADKELDKFSFRGTFEDDKIEEVLRLLTMTSPIIYQVIPGSLLSNGTFEKEKIVIYLKKKYNKLSNTSQL